MQKSANQLETGTFSAPDKSPNNPAPGRRFDNKFFATMQTFDFRNIAMTSTPRSTAPALKQAIAAAVFALIASLILDQPAACFALFHALAVAGAYAS
jgi:hypothetical protein